VARRIFLGESLMKKAHLKAKKCGFDVANAHKFLKISD
jgi:hypothetical protein